MCTSTQSQPLLRPEFWLTGARSLNKQLFSLSFQTHRIFVVAAARALLHVAEFPFILIIFRLLHRVTTVNPAWCCRGSSAPSAAFCPLTLAG